MPQGHPPRMIFLKRLLWSAATNLFAAWIMVDMFLSTELNTVPQHSFNGSVYDFIIGKTQGHMGIYPDSI